jgi:hypothetical protein
MSLWLLALVEIAVNTPDEREWRIKSEALVNLGYRVPAESIDDLVPVVATLHASFVSVAAA